MEQKGNMCGVLVGKPVGKYHLLELGVDDRIMLK
jgi:hypothetical protein